MLRKASNHARMDQRGYSAGFVKWVCCPKARPYWPGSAGIRLLDPGQGQHAAYGALAKAAGYQEFVLFHLGEYGQPFAFVKAQLGVVPAMHNLVDQRAPP